MDSAVARWVGLTATGILFAMAVVAVGLAFTVVRANAVERPVFTVAPCTAERR